jgi:alkanesulfonate monooxygenase SsuD/methylene tetrahydromethanopterin reductase-like flavin-dependent oxidoreductase (luciferase family)
MMCATSCATRCDSRAYHLAAEDQDRTTERHDKLAAHGILPLHFAEAEQLGVITGLWRTTPGDRFSYHGQHYQLEECASILRPAPIPSTSTSTTSRTWTTSGYSAARS